MMKEEVVLLRSGARARVCRGTLEAKVGVIALHPWGPLGGSMDDPHVVTVTRLFGSQGCATARVAFRTGFSCGASPLLDVEAAAEVLLDMDNIDRILVVGYSYGSIVAMAADFPESIGWVSINPPLDVTWALFLFKGHEMLERARKTQKPKLLLHATNDGFCSNESFDSFVKSLPDHKLPINIPGANHFDVIRHIPDAIHRFLREAFHVTDFNAFVRGDFPASSPP